jgi:restriction system protein
VADHTCPNCGTSQEITAGAPGYRCRKCQTDVRLLPCHRCGFVFLSHGPVIGGGVWQARCPNCRTRNFFSGSDLRRATALARQAERAKRESERAATLEEKEAKRLYLEARQAEVHEKNEDLAEYILELQSLLSSTLSVDDHIDFEKLKEVSSSQAFDPGSLEKPDPTPVLQDFMPPEPSGLGKLVPGAQAKYERAAAEAKARFEIALQDWTLKEETRKRDLDVAAAEHRQKTQELQEAAEAQHREIDELRRRFEEDEAGAMAAYFRYVLEFSVYPEGFPREFRLAYVPESRQLVIDFQFPSLEIVPETKEFKYVKSKDEITEVARAKTQRNALYASVVSQISLRTLHEVFEADRTHKIDTLVFSGYVSTVDRRTGKPAKPYLVTVRTTRDSFLELDLSQVDPRECLKHLNASVSANPAELALVRPVLEFNMVDPRFIEESDVLSTLDQRPNLMELSSREFESLITNLFEKMGLETRQTTPSRDGGVDCVAYDPRPIFGGKVVIQAKRYKNTVGVSAVRDLFGTLQNEGASKGILVTTSGYGRAAFEFASGKPMELLDGANLLYLLQEHAGLEARIVAPEDWVDPIQTGET